MQRTRLEGDSKVVLAQTGAAVSNLDDGVRAIGYRRVRVDREMNLRPLGRNPQGVLHQVVDDLPQAHRINVHVDGPRCFRKRQGDAIAIASSSPHLCRLGEDLPHINVGGVDVKVCGTQSGEVEKVVDESVQTTRLVTDGRTNARQFFGVEDVVVKSFRVTPDRREWRSQFVRDRQQELPLATFGRREGGIQRVQCLGDIRDLRRPPRG